jgi:putative oxidoreductase
MRAPVIDRPWPWTLDGGLLVVRLALGLVIFVHGCIHLFGLGGVGGLDATAAAFQRMGYHPGRAFATLDGCTEVASGLLIALGLLTPLGAAGVVAVMGNVLWLKRNGGFYGPRGFEFELTLLLLALALLLAGPGRLAADRLVLGARAGGSRLALAALALGIIGAAVTLGLRH